MSELEEILNSDPEERMQKAFEQEAKRILSQPGKYEKNPEEQPLVGLETEYALINFHRKPASNKKRNKVKEKSKLFDTEVGGSQIEVQTNPVRLNSLNELETHLRTVEETLREEAAKEQAEVIRTGTNPFTKIKDISITNEDKYEIVPNFHKEHRNPDVQDKFGVKDSIDPRNVNLAGVINSTQTNIEANSIEDAVEKTNMTYMISPYLNAISSNAQLIDQKDLGVKDMRMPLWEISHDTRPDMDQEKNVGVLNEYFEHFEDYAAKVQEQPFMLHEEEAALDIGIGTYWKDARIKEEGNSLVVESRIISTQPTISEEMSMHAFYLGRLNYAQQTNEDLIDIEKVNKNRYSAMHNGLDTKLYTPEGELKNATEVLQKELDKAKTGLEQQGLETEYLEPLYQRVEQETTPSDLASQRFAELEDTGLKTEEALYRAIKGNSTIT